MKRPAAALKDGEASRDRLKAVKFQRMKDQGTLPQYILDMFEDAGKMSGQKRREQTDIINTLLDKDDAGNYVLKLMDEKFKDPVLATCSNMYITLIYVCNYTSYRHC